MKRELLNLIGSRHTSKIQKNLLAKDNRIVRSILSENITHNERSSVNGNTDKTSMEMRKEFFNHVKETMKNVPSDMRKKFFTQITLDWNCRLKDYKDFILKTKSEEELNDLVLNDKANLNVLQNAPVVNEKQKTKPVKIVNEKQKIENKPKPNVEDCEAAYNKAVNQIIKPHDATSKELINAYFYSLQGFMMKHGISKKSANTYLNSKGIMSDKERNAKKK